MAKNKTLKIFSLLIFFLFQTFANAFSQAELKSEGFDNVNDYFLTDYVSRIWTVSDGLPGNSITDIIQDSSGYIYFGTYEGLVRFDGVEFVILNRAYESKYDFVAARTLFQDSLGTIWIGSNDDGLIGLHKDGSVEKYTVETGLPNNSIRAICEDKDQNIWVGTAAGVVYLRPAGLLEPRTAIRPLGLDLYGEENILVFNIFCDTAGRIWITSSKENGLFVYSNLSKSFSRYEGIKKIEKPIVDCVTQDKNGSFWFGISSGYAVRIDGDMESVFKLPHGKQRTASVNDIFQDKNSNIWFATDTGVVILHDGKFSSFETGNGLSDESVAKILEDREGNIWFATSRGGLQKLSLSKFNTINMSTSVNAIASDSFRGVTWLGGDDGLYCYKNKQFVKNDITELCKNIRIRDVEIAKNGDLLISTYEKYGVIRVGVNGGKKFYTSEEGLSGMRTRVTMTAKNGDLYIGTTTGLNIVDSKTNKITTVTKEDGLKNDFIMCIYQDSKGTVWCGTDGGGMFSIENGKIGKTYTTENGIAGNVIFKIDELCEDELWITTGNGISRLKDGKFFNFNSSNGLGTDSVFQILLDYTQTAWITSNRGILSINFNEMEDLADGKRSRINPKYFGRADGLVSGGITSTSRSMKDSIGRLWFTLIDGFAIYDPVKAASNKTQPLVEIQEVQIDSKKFAGDVRRFILPPSVKRLSFKFTGLTFVSSDQTQFSYKLEGFDDDFSDWTYDRNVSYTNLRPGSYKFFLYSKNGDDVKSEVSKEISIIKKPFVWELAWFWILFVLLFIGIIILIVWLRFCSMRNYQIVLENKVDERTKELSVEIGKSRSLLLNILPEYVANELSENPNETNAQKFPNATVLFTDIVGFTKISEKLSAEEVVKLLNQLITMFDLRAKNEGVEKIKTIGDSYMAATGLTSDSENDGALRMLNYAKGILEDVEEFNRNSKVKLQIRLGINTGNLVAGVIGKTKFIYDIWGDTVNVASRMESSGVPMRIHVTESTYKETKSEYSYDEPVEVEVKGKGMMKTYYVS